MNSRTRYAIAVAVLTVMVAGIAWAAKAVHDFDPNADFSSYTTYGWIEREGSADEQLPEHLRMRLRRVTEEVLAEKGLVPAPAPPQTDLLLTYYFGHRDELQVNHIPYSTYSPWGYGYWGGFNYGYTEVRSYTKGTLLLDIVDAHTHQLVWTGTLTGEVRSVNPSGKRITKAINKLLKKFPPS